MNTNAAAELESVKQELIGIISELEDISMAIKVDFKGIGNERCSLSVDSVVNRYRHLLRQLDNIKLTGNALTLGGGGGA